MAQDREEWIKLRAHQIWEAEGRPHGRHDEHWRQAEQEFESGQGTAQETAATVDDLGRVAGGASTGPGSGSTGSTPLEAVVTKGAVQGKP
jgi:hypothetical protein